MVVGFCLFINCSFKLTGSIVVSCHGIVFHGVNLFIYLFKLNVTGLALSKKVHE